MLKNPPPYEGPPDLEDVREMVMESIIIFRREVRKLGMRWMLRDLSFLHVRADKAKSEKALLVLGKEFASLRKAVMSRRTP
jgi:hypothetical protein